MLQSERIRVIGLILVLSFLWIVIAIRALFGGLPEQLHLLPRFTALILASTAYEGLMLRLVSRAIQRRSDLPLWVWSVNTGIEALIPTALLVLVTESPFLGPYRALGAPATHGYYIFIILSTLHLRPGVCFWTGLASALGFGAVTVYTLVVYPAGPGPGGRIYPLQVYATTGILFLTCGTIAAWLAGQFRRHLVAALGEAAIRGQYERLVREIAQREQAEQALRVSERRYRQLTEGTHDAIVVADQQGIITLFNPAAQALFGYPEPDVRGQPLTILMPEEYREAHRGGFRRYLGDERNPDHRSHGRSARPAQRRRDVPAGDVPFGHRSAGGDRLPGRDPRPDRAPAPARALDPGGQAGLAGPAQRRGGARDQQPAGLRGSIATSPPPQNWT